MGGLIDGREYVFEVRAVNGLGKGGAETVTATPEQQVTPPGNGGGGGGALLFPPEAPAAVTALPGDGTVRLEWGPPASDGGSPVLRYEYRLKEGRGEFGEWTPIPDSAPDEVNASGYTVGGLGNGTVHVFELRAVNAAGAGQVSEAVEVRDAAGPGLVVELPGGRPPGGATDAGGVSLEREFRGPGAEVWGGVAVRGRRAGRGGGSDGDPDGELRVPLHQPDDGTAAVGLRRGGGLRFEADLYGRGHGQLRLSLRRGTGGTGELPVERAEPGAGDHQHRSVRGRGEHGEGSATGGGGLGRRGPGDGVRGSGRRRRGAVCH